MLISYHDEKFERDEVLEEAEIQGQTYQFLIMYAAYEDGLGDHPVMGFSVRSCCAATPDRDGVCASFDSFIEAKAYFDYIKSIKFVG